MYRRFILLVAFSLSALLCFCQNRLFEDYYTEAKAFVSAYKTYKILLVRGDTTFAPKANDQRNQLKIVFPFLHMMSEVKNNPDFLIKIIIRDTNLQVNYKLLSSNEKQNEYQLKYYCDLKFQLQFDAGGQHSLSVPLCEFIHYESFLPGLGNGTLTLKNTDDGLPAHHQWNDIDFWVSMIETHLERKEEFRDEFVSALKKFSKDNCR